MYVFVDSSVHSSRTGSLVGETGAGCNTQHFLPK